MVICDSLCQQGFHTACFGMPCKLQCWMQTHGTAEAAQCCSSWQWGSKSSQKRPKACTLVVHQLSPTTPCGQGLGKVCT